MNDWEVTEPTMVGCFDDLLNAFCGWLEANGGGRATLRALSDEERISPAWDAELTIGSAGVDFLQKMERWFIDSTDEIRLGGMQRLSERIGFSIEPLSETFWLVTAFWNMPL